MDDEYKKLTVELADILTDKSLLFVMKILEKKTEEDTSNLINLILSSHISSLGTCMRDLTHDNKMMMKHANNFLKELLIFVENYHLVSKVEVIDNGT